MAVRRLLERAAAELKEPTWRVVGGQRLQTKLSSQTSGIILALPAGYVIYDIKFAIGPRFPAIERVVAKARRVAGLPNDRTSSAFPTVFDSLSSFSALPDYMSVERIGEIIAALRANAIPFVHDISTLDAAADYALTHPLAFGHHSMRIPVILAKAGRVREADEYFDRIIAQGPYSDSLQQYRKAVSTLL